MKKMYYFGMLAQGHCLYENVDGHEVSARQISIPGFYINPRLSFPDGIFPPGQVAGGKYLLCSVPPLLIVSWWDYSGDTRGGSNSNLIAFGYTGADQILDDAVKLFPTVMKRQPRPTPYFTQLNLCPTGP